MKLNKYTIQMSLSLLCMAIALLVSYVILIADGLDRYEIDEEVKLVAFHNLAENDFSFQFSPQFESLSEIEVNLLIVRNLNTNITTDTKFVDVAIQITDLEREESILETKSTIDIGETGYQRLIAIFDEFPNSNRMYRVDISGLKGELAKDVLIGVDEEFNPQYRQLYTSDFSGDFVRSIYFESINLIRFIQFTGMVFLLIFGAIPIISVLSLPNIPLKNQVIYNLVFGIWIGIVSLLLIAFDLNIPTVKSTILTLGITMAVLNLLLLRFYDFSEEV